jgi:hypothetical protein
MLECSFAPLTVPLLGFLGFPITTQVGGFSASPLRNHTACGADINVDGKFMGSTPSTIQLSPGEHLVSVEKEGLRPWQRTMTVSAGGSVTIDATLEKP